MIADLCIACEGICEGIFVKVFVEVFVKEFVNVLYIYPQTDSTSRKLCFLQLS